jgi:nucleotide-binding universal stress UspA family protein
LKILVGYDGSNVTKAALELARQHAKVWGAKIDVVKCMAQNRDLEYEDIRKAEENLEGEIHCLLNSDKLPYETHLLISKQDFGEELVGFAEQNKIDEIIIGIRKKSKARKLIFGSTAQYVILNAPCPVACVK